MFGIGQTELLIIGLICLVTVVPGVIGIGVLIWFALKKNRKSSSGENIDAQ
jgi:hypothetical protein